MAETIENKADSAAAVIEAQEPAEESLESCQKRDLSSPPTKDDEPAVKKARVEVPSIVNAEKLMRIRRQVEYYFKDENLRYDSYFQEKIKENDGWLDIKHILSCQKIKDLQATAADVEAALEPSDLVFEDANGQARVKRTEPLPPLEQRPARRQPGGGPGSKGSINSDPFACGPILECGPVPADATWERIKAVIVGTAEKKIEEMEPARRPRFEGLFFVSHIVEGKCFALVRPFDGDVAFFKEHLSKIKIGEADVSIQIVTDAAVGAKAVGLAPMVIRNSRESLLKRNNENKNKRSINNKPISIGGMDFKNIGHLGDCLREVLGSKSTEGKSPVNDRVSCVLDELLRRYHPRGEAKLKDKVCFVSGLSEQGGSSGKKNQRCFFVKRADGTYEDFSIMKCIQAMKANPEGVFSVAVPVAARVTAPVTDPVTALVTEPVKEPVTVAETVAEPVKMAVTVTVGATAPPA